MALPRPPIVRPPPPRAWVKPVRPAPVAKPVPLPPPATACVAAARCEAGPAYVPPDVFVLSGASADVLQGLQDDSVDSLVTDPPAGISFMGKAFDTNHGGREGFVASLVPVFAECLRVMKPGAYGLVWAFPRTSHWTATALEDAGFEIRDRVSHLHGQGFPKNLDIGKALDKQGGKDISWFPMWLEEARAHAGISRNVLATHFPSRTGGTTGCVWNWEHGIRMPSTEQFNRLCSLFHTEVAPIEVVERRFIATRKGVTKTYNVGSTTIVGTRPDVTAPASDAAKQWEGWGTALKPACEDWWLVRKPLVGTVAANVLKHGVGGLNINGCRIACAEGDETLTNHARSADAAVSKGVYGDSVAQETHQTPGQKLGRWPANVVLSHSDECVCVGTWRVAEGRIGDMSGGGRSTTVDNYGTETIDVYACVPWCAVRILDEQSGKRGAAAPASSPKGVGRHDHGIYQKVADGFRIDGKGSAFYADTGGASRFYYAAKPSRAEREAGCEALPARSGAAAVDRAEGSAGTKSPRAGADRTAKEVRNQHPTVKSIALMRWLARLITPPGGVVLDPFGGSGTTACAAILEGFHVVIVEQDPEYVKIIEERTAHWLAVAAKENTP